MNVTTILAGFGVLLLAPVVFRFAVFVYTYLPYIHDRAIEKYLWSRKPYALVTAASDGIGKAIAWELCERGFGVVLHGRNEEKLRKVKEEFQARLNGKERDIRFVVFDAGEGKWEFKELAKELEELDVTVVAHVVGSSDVLSSS
jgi:17beta-estradiol 17-dehydrogenase / very-long-chain 3-oxoacyl-CoA reductase